MRAPLRLLACAPVLASAVACASAGTGAPGEQAAARNASLDIDHVIVGIDSLERGIDLLRQLTGLTAVYGGAHPNAGTHNALLSLGPGKYLELLAPNPKDSVRTPRTRALSRYRGPIPIGWAALAPNADSLRTVFIQRGLPGGNVVPGSRARPDGSTLRWRTVSPWGPLNRAILPFFIEWTPGTHPSTQSPTGCTLVTMRLVTPRPDSVRALLGAASLRVAVDSGGIDGINLELECPTGRVKLPPTMGSGFGALRTQPPPIIERVSLGIARDSVERLLGKPDRVGPTDDGSLLLTYNRGQPNALQIAFRDGRVAGINLLTREAGSIDGMTVGMPFIRLLTHWGQPTRVDATAGAGIWQATGWEIVAHPDVEAQTVRFLQLRINGIRACPYVSDGPGRGRYVC
jgi:hypothetical protein